MDAGLKEGDRVIVEGMMKVKPDMVVAPVDFIMNENADQKTGGNN